MSLWEERAGRNQAFFREVNERLGDLQDAGSRDDERVDFICECADDACAERIPVPVADYERVRSHPRQFIIHPGHQDPEIEQVVEAFEKFLIVEKVGTAGRVATSSDPRG